MKKNKLILIVSAVACVVLAAVVAVIANIQPKHKHTFTDAITYHLSSEGIHYTKQCKDGCIERFETAASFVDVLSTTTSKDTIVLDEDVTLYSEVLLKSYITKDEQPQGLSLNINLDLNNHKLSTSVQNKNNNSMFTLNANYGQINFNVKNGTLYTDNLLYLFRFANGYNMVKNINLTLNDVECRVVGNMATPLAAYTDCQNIVVNATDSKFIAEKPATADKNTSVGVLINSESEFNFTNCYFEGGDAVYVKRGKVNLNGCELKSVGAVSQSISEIASIDDNAQYATYVFNTIGACLTAESYKNASGNFSEFDVTITDCVMKSEYTFIMIYISRTLGAGASSAGVNPESRINIVSGEFVGGQPCAKQYGIVDFASPATSNAGIWTVG